MSASHVRLMLVDDHPCIRLGLNALFRTVPHFEVVGEAGTAAQAIALARTARPDVVIMDVSLPYGDGADACREIRAQRPDTRVIMLTAYDNRDVVLGAILAGAAGYLLKETDPERLVESVEIVARHGALLDPAVTAAVLDTIRQLAPRAGDRSLAGLREQEQRILPLLAEGKTNAEIASELHLSPHTVKEYVSDILAKLHLRRRAQAAAYLARRVGPTRG
jgi:two-component system, NarL family, response regulator DevR